MNSCEGRIGLWLMREVGRPKVSAGVNSRKTSSKDLMSLNIDYTEMTIYGYHLKSESTIKKRMTLHPCKLLTVYQLRFLQQIKRYKMMTLDRTLELLIYKWFLFLEILRVAKFNRLLIMANWRNKAEKFKVRRNEITQRSFFYFFNFFF